MILRRTISFLPPKVMSLLAMMATYLVDLYLKECATNVLPNG